MSPEKSQKAPVANAPKPYNERKLRAKGKPLVLPVLPRRDAVLFPRMMAQLMVMRQAPLRAIEDAWAGDRRVVVVARKDPNATSLTLEDLHRVGTEATIGRLLRMPDGSTGVWVQGERRVLMVGLEQGELYFKARVIPIRESTEKSLPLEALSRSVLALFEKCVKLSTKLPEDAYVAAMNIDDPGWLADFICTSLDLGVPQRQEILETIPAYERLQQVNVFLAKELEVLELQSKIHIKVKEEVDKSQREYFLREELKAIQRELGEIDPLTKEMNELKKKIGAAGMPPAAAKKAEEEMERLLAMPPASPEVSVIRSYLDWLIALPWAKETEDNLDIGRAARVLDENHYGLTKVKERILEYISVRKLAAERMRSPILCFVGAPGVGKTSLGKSIALALGRNFVRVSLGGIRDEAEIRGHRRTYVGALPGRVIQTMRNAGSINPVFMLDEIDKVGMDFRGDPSSALLEVLDPEQNHSFSDHYLDVPYSLAKVIFITTANVLDPVLPALRDRMEVIELPGYTEEEKLEIARIFLVPKQRYEHGLNEGQLHFSDGALRLIIREYTREAGVRNLEREIAGICRKVAKRVAEGKKTKASITTQAVSTYLGPPKVFWGAKEEKDVIGVATGVARTEMGGDVMSVEVTLMPGKGELLLTGQLGDVMKESAQAALSYARSKWQEIGLKGPVSLQETDIHVHVPEGAIPKDGPSAGITMATALISALKKQAISRDVAMTGEITLRGRVLPVGGLKEKSLAAHRAGIKVFILPRKNKNDLDEIPLHVRKEMRFVFVDDMQEVLETALASSSVEPLVAVGTG